MHSFTPENTLDKGMSTQSQLSMVSLLQITVSAVNINYCDLGMMLVFQTDTFALELLLKENMEKKNLICCKHSYIVLFKKSYLLQVVPQRRGTFP